MMRDYQEISIIPEHYYYRTFFVLLLGPVTCVANGTTTHQPTFIIMTLQMGGSCWIESNPALALRIKNAFCAKEAAVSINTTAVVLGRDAGYICTFIKQPATSSRTTTISW